MTAGLPSQSLCHAEVQGLPLLFGTLTPIFLLPASGAGGAIFVVQEPKWTGRMGSGWRG